MPVMASEKGPPTLFNTRQHPQQKGPEESGPFLFFPLSRLMKSCPEGAKMKKRQALEIVSEQIVELQERLEGSADPVEKSVLVQRLDNLKKLFEFLASHQSEAIAAGKCA